MWNCFSKASFFGMLLFCLLVSLAAQPVDAAKPKPLSDVQKTAATGKYKLTPKVDKLEKSVTTEMQTPVDALSPEDSENLNMLWQTVIARNPVIQYGLKQLATPPELRYAQSSIMSRTVAGLLSGAAMLPFVMGADQYTSGATMMGANLVDRAMTQSQKVDPSQLPSDTELVELSGVIQTLQKSLVEHYFQYKGSLSAAVQLADKEGLYDKNYRRAKQTPTAVDDLWSLKQLEDIRHQQLVARQSARQSFLVLERLVGTEGMRKLRFDGTVLSNQAEQNKKLSYTPGIE